MEDGLSNNIVYKICEGRDGAIWFGTLKGISRFDSKIGRFSSVPFDSKNLKVESLIEDKKGNLWFSSEKGLYRYNGKVLDCFTTEQGLPANVIHSFLEDSKGNLWIGTKGGISCFKDGKFTNYTTADGLPHNKCNFFVEDRRGNLWLGTVNGLCFFDGTTFTTYTAKKHELATDYWETGFIDSQGYIWLGSGEGVTRFLPPPLRPNIVPPPIHFTTVKVLEKEIPLSRLHQLSHDQNYIRFEFKGLCYSSPETVRYKYFLEGIDKNWKETKNPSIFYYLPHGKYRFKVKAVNYDGVESTVPAAVSFRIHPAFWQTWWFKALMVWLVLFIMGLLFLWRYKQAKAKTELRARTHQLVMAQRMELMGTLASGTVHDLKNLLIVIISVAQVMGQTYDKEDKNYKHIEIIEDTTKTAMHMAKQILSFARYNSDQVPGNADLVYLLMEIIKTLELTSPKSVSIKPILSPKPIMFPIHPARFQQLVMNLCLNAVQAMPQGGELNITIAYSDEETIRLDIGDTGSGISPSLTGKIFEPLFTTKGQEDGTGLGLFVVKQVVTEHNGTIDVHSEPGKTTFTIRFPALSST
ncbi:MAG: hypothetical protein GY757_31140 [bacterium]|nr:hypothetical protein [bacterium]